MDFIQDEALKWYLRHVIHVNWNQLQWSFTDVVMGLYDCFVQLSTMQDTHEVFRKAAYIAEDGVQGYYDSLLNHAQNMAVYPDEYTICEKFLDGIPSDMLIALICNGGLSPEVNTVEDFVSEAKAYETSLKTATHYLERSTHVKMARQAPSATQLPNRIVGTVLVKRAELNHTKPVQGSGWQDGRPVNMHVVPCRTAGFNKPASPQQAVHAATTNQAVAKRVEAGNGVVGTQDASGVECYRCSEMGHFAKDCTNKPNPGQRPARNRVYVRAVHTAIPDDGDVADDEKDELLAADAANEQCKEDQVEEQPEESSDKYVELAVYENNFYTSGDDQDHLFALTECLSSLVQGDVLTNQVQMRKVKVLTSKEALK
ncbi:hypothetical protein DXG01_017172 [Tephrocybe rancida]|nr:hypothetical protein DXG01_017172 [Tephrocybe rancida]